MVEDRARNKMVIADLHGRWQGLLNLMRKAGAIDFDGPDIDHRAPSTDVPNMWEIRRNPDWWICQLGDGTHMGPAPTDYELTLEPWLIKYKYKDDTTTAVLLEQLCDEILVGNHEAYFTHNLEVGRFRGMYANVNEYDPFLMHTFRRILGHSDKFMMTPPEFPWRRLTAAATTFVNGQPWLITHAGLHPAYSGTILDNLDGPITRQKLNMDDYDEIARFLNRNLIDLSMHVLDPKDVPWICSVGRDSGGHNPYGGIFWLRPKECKDKYYASNRVKLNQIVGHTPKADEHPRYVGLRRTWYIDNDGASALVSYDDAPWKPITFSNFK